MKHFILLVSLIIFAIKGYSQANCFGGQNVVFGTTFNQCNNNPWVLVFEDNFGGNNLDLSRWGYGPRNRYCNDELQYFTHGDNIQVSNGTLKIITKKETIFARSVDWLPDNEILYCKGENRGQNARYFNYTSGNIETTRTFSQGKFEARVKIPKGKGFWPAFWTYGGNPVPNEIDIFEFMNENNPSNLSKVHNMTVHYDYDADGDPSSCHTDYTGVDFSMDFHIFTLVWDADKILWYVDGTLKRRDCRYYTITGAETGCTIYAMQPYVKKLIYPQNPMNIIFDLAIQGGNYSPDASTSFPSQMEVDWVRYYKRVLNPCQDLTITNASQFPLDSQLFNAIVGQNVTINCAYTVPLGQQLDIVAGNSVTLGYGFSAELGSVLNVRIEPTICN